MHPQFLSLASTWAFLCTFITLTYVYFPIGPRILLCLGLQIYFPLNRLFYCLRTFVDSHKANPKRETANKQKSKPQQSWYKGSVQPSLWRVNAILQPLAFLLKWEYTHESRFFFLLLLVSQPKFQEVCLDYMIPDTTPWHLTKNISSVLNGKKLFFHLIVNDFIYIESLIWWMFFFIEFTLTQIEVTPADVGRSYHSF